MISAPYHSPHKKPASLGPKRFSCQSDMGQKDFFSYRRQMPTPRIQKSLCCTMFFTPNQREARYSHPYSQVVAWWSKTVPRLPTGLVNDQWTRLLRIESWPTTDCDCCQNLGWDLSEHPDYPKNLKNQSWWSIVATCCNAASCWIFLQHLQYSVFVSVLQTEAKKGLWCRRGQWSHPRDQIPPFSPCNQNFSPFALAEPGLSLELEWHGVTWSDFFCWSKMTSLATFYRVLNWESRFTSRLISFSAKTSAEICV